MGRLLWDAKHYMLAHHLLGVNSGVRWGTLRKLLFSSLFLHYLTFVPAILGWILNLLALSQGGDLCLVLFRDSPANVLSCTLILLESGLHLESLL